MEIERKFLLKTLPCDFTAYEKSFLRQGYISLNPSIRLRSADDAVFYLTVKGSGEIAREEFELKLTQSQFERLWSKTEGNIIEKVRYRIPLESGLIAELDEYTGRLRGLYTVEVEFKTLTEAENFEPPEWFGRDVTADLRYRNSQLSIETPPVS